MKGTVICKTPLQQLRRNTEAQYTEGCRGEDLGHGPKKALARVKRAMAIVKRGAAIKKAHICGPLPFPRQSALRELGPASRLAQTDFLTLNLSRITRYKSCLA